ncbi:MAG TPA: gamma-glutamyl-gamma-aminobutyrate hydrolase family protein [Pyrinomonadaceae bacterium]|nr:gamma-glutamyl-gamma-aminobutyrate hydrolase family protein [Pyrinomonadaceae bacterium]
MAYRPRIGLTMRLELETRRFYLGRDYSEAVVASGGSPVHIPLIPDRDFIQSVVNGLDGILLPGSDTDVDPVKYGEEPHAKLKKVIPEKDETDAVVLEVAEELNLPVFAICYGMQALNVSRGGTLVQDINAQVDDAVRHEQGMPLAPATHGLRVSGSGLLAEIIGDDLKWRVNSHHHQAVAKVGRDLEAIAWASDGVIEAIQDPRPERFVLGVQWHPELSWQTDDLSRELFEMFVSRCGERVSETEILTDEVALVG